MKKIFNVKLSALAMTALLGASILLTGCGSDSSESSSTAGGSLSGTVSIIGSTSVGPLAQDLADSFSADNSDVNIEIQQIGSTEGIKAIHDGTTDIGTASRELNDEEKTWGLDEHIIAYDGIAIIVNPDNGVENLSSDQITKIFKGEIKNWKEVGGKDKEIVLINREAGSGTRGAFEELLKLQEKQADGTKKTLISDKALVVGSNGEVKTNVASKDNAIGYISLGIVDKTVKALKVDNVEATEANVKSKTYPVWRPFLMLTKGELKPEVKAFLDYIMSDKGQKMVAKDYVSVN